MVPLLEERMWKPMQAVPGVVSKEVDVRLRGSVHRLPPFKFFSKSSYLSSRACPSRRVWSRLSTTDVVGTVEVDVVLPPDGRSRHLLVLAEGDFENGDVSEVVKQDGVMLTYDFTK